MKVYDEQTQPLIDYYSKLGKLNNLPVEGEIKDMVHKIYGLIDDHLSMHGEYQKPI